MTTDETATPDLSDLPPDVLKQLTVGFKRGQTGNLPSEIICQIVGDLNGKADMDTIIVEAWRRHKQKFKRGILRHRLAVLVRAGEIEKRMGARYALAEGPER